MNEKSFKGTAVILVLIFMVSSCIFLPKDRTIDDLMANLSCIEYTSEIRWADVTKILGEPDIYPLPSKGEPLSRNTRFYKNKSVIFYIDLKELKVGDRTRYEEVVTKAVICTPR